MTHAAYKTTLSGLALLVAALAVVLALVLADLVAQYSAERLRTAPSEPAASAPDAFEQAAITQPDLIAVLAALGTISQGLLAFSGVVTVLVLLGIAGLCLQEAAPGEAASRPAPRAGDAMRAAVPPPVGAESREASAVDSTPVAWPRVRETVSRAALWLVPLLALGLAACGPTRLVHLDSAPFEPRLPLVYLNGGWLAVDSCATGLHALLELEVETGRQTPVLDRLSLARLWYYAAGLPLTQQPRHIRVEGPLCWNEGPRHFREGAGQAGLFPLQNGEPTCVYLVRAQFVLDRLPAPADPLVLRYEGRPLTVRSQ